MKTPWLVALGFLLVVGQGRANDLDKCPGGGAASPQRYLAAISDVHLGNGNRADGSWHPTEDFRWDGALESFLGQISECGEGRVDLVIAGDLLELWQPLKGVRCARKDGCTAREMERIADHVVGQHRRALAAFKAFAETSDNRLHVVPGNHDAALLLPNVWSVLARAVGAAPGRVNLVASGLYLSADKAILIEHGHQIGSDPNSYSAWPQILRKANGGSLVEQPWGENFVQSIYNAEEETYPTIDNLSPESAGVRYRMSDRGAWRTAKDMARFLAFNLFETSLRQKGMALGQPGEEAKWDLDEGRSMGHLLFANALRADDPFRRAILAQDDAAAELRTELDALARVSKVADVELMCNQIAIRNPSEKQCAPSSLGAAAEKLLVPRKRVIEEHLRSRLAGQGMDAVRVFIYGHTHLYEDAWPIDLSSFRQATVLNTGAFQRVVDEDGFLARVAKKPGLTPAQALRDFQPEELAPCYGAVLVPYEGATPKPVTVRWHTDEGASGKFVSTNDPRCQ